eukprot:4482539-Pleurochrysis_carterae.AAC.1
MARRPCRVDATEKQSLELEDGDRLRDAQRHAQVRALRFRLAALRRRHQPAALAVELAAPLLSAPEAQKFTKMHEDLALASARAAAIRAGVGVEQPVHLVDARGLPVHVQHAAEAAVVPHHETKRKANLSRTARRSLSQSERRLPLCDKSASEAPAPCASASSWAPRRSGTGDGNRDLMAANEDAVLSTESAPSELRTLKTLNESCLLTVSSTSAALRAKAKRSPTRHSGASATSLPVAFAAAAATLGFT